MSGEGLVDVGGGLREDVSIPMADAWESPTSALTRRGEFVDTDIHFLKAELIT